VKTVKLGIDLVDLPLLVGNCDSRRWRYQGFGFPNHSSITGGSASTAERMRSDRVSFDARPRAPSEFRPHEWGISRSDRNFAGQGGLATCMAWPCRLRLLETVTAPSGSTTRLLAPPDSRRRQTVSLGSAARRADDVLDSVRPPRGGALRQTGFQPRCFRGQDHDSQIVVDMFQPILREQRAFRMKDAGKRGELLISGGGGREGGQVGLDLGARDSSRGDGPKRGVGRSG